MDEVTLQSLLEGVQANWQATDPIQRRAIFRAMHTLAEHHYAPAIPFFASGLTDRDPTWRLEVLKDLGHYPTLDDTLLEHIHIMLTTDPDGDIRIVAASLLGLQNSTVAAWPDWALEQALREDPIHEVRAAAFQALLLTAHLQGFDLRALDRRVEGGDLRPTWAEIARIITSANVDPRIANAIRLRMD